MGIRSRKTAKQSCGKQSGLSVCSRSYAEKNNNILNSLAIAIHKNKGNAAGKNENVLHP